MVDEVMENLKTTRSITDATFDSWYKEGNELAENIGVPESVPRKTSIQRHRSNTSSDTPMQHYKTVIAIPLLDSLS